MDFMMEIYQREAMQFYLESTPAVDYEGQYVNVIIKKTNDTSQNNDSALINKTKQLTEANLSPEDFEDCKNGIIKINLDSTETNLQPNDYKVMIQITDTTNTTANILSDGLLKIKDNYLKKV